MPDTPQRFHLTYDITTHPDGILKSEIPQGHGGCDDIAIVSVVKGDGAVSRAFFGLVGAERRAMDPGDEFACWATWANRLREILPPGSWQCRAVEEADDLVTMFIREARGR